tara:strand:+ start:16 stop:1470 length:1455 start_codon:yes stop_codon:yes gene_type:complete
MKKKYFIISVLILILLGISSVFIGYSENKFVNTIKILVPTPVKNFVKKNIFFVSDIRSELFRLKKNVNRQNTQIDYLKGQIQIQKKNTNYLLSELQSEKNFFVSPLISQNEKIQTEKGNNYKMKKFYYPSIPWQFNEKKPAGYLYNYQNLVYSVTGDANLYYFDMNDVDKDKLRLNIIKTNLKEYLKDENIFKSGKVSIRGIFISNEKIFLSYMHEVKKDCYNMSILFSDFGLNNLVFKNFFSYDINECSKNMSNHTGGRMIPFNNDSFLFTTGDGQLYAEAQNSQSMWGKLLKINYDGTLNKIVAKGMRDTQGATYYSKDKVVVMSEHGPTGGDEINAITYEEIMSDNEVNFGWPIATYGEIKYIKIKENKFTIKDELNHSKNGFKEPIAHYTPSVAPSHIINVDNFNEKFSKDFFMSTLGNMPGIGRRALHHLKFDDEYKKVVYSDIINVGERIRDMIYVSEFNKVILILELSPSITILEAL